MKRQEIIELTFIFLVFCLFVSSCSKKEKVYPINNVEDLVSQKDITSEASAYVDSLLTSLTLEERVGQCLMPSLPAQMDPYTLRLYGKYIEDYHVGGVVLLQGDLQSARKLGEIGKESRVPLFVAIDAEWGLGMRLEDAPKYPKNGNIKKETSETELYDYGREIAKESREAGINMILGPVVDITSGNKGIIGKRSFGDNPDMVSEYGVAYAKGLESGGVISIAKHFPGHGSTVIDSHKGIARINRDITTMDSLDLRPFRDYINSGLTGIMAGHIQSYALDPDGNAASVSMDMLTTLLREEMGFKGLILTDAFDMGGAKGFSAVDALKAGADLVLCPRDIGAEYKLCLEKLYSGQLDIQILNDRVRRILFYKYIFGILDPYKREESL